MKIQGNRIRSLDTREPRRQVRRQDRKCSEGAIDVEPQFFPMRDVGERREIVDGSDIDRAGRADDEKRREGGASVDRNGGFERIGVDLMTLIRGDNAKCINTQTGDIHGLGNAAMGSRRYIRDQPLLALRNAFAASCDTQCGSASDEHAQ